MVILLDEQKSGMAKARHQSNAGLIKNPRFVCRSMAALGHQVPKGSNHPQLVYFNSALTAS
jgi:hypothetical protein